MSIGNLFIVQLLNSFNPKRGLSFIPLKLQPKSGKSPQQRPLFSIKIYNRGFGFVLIGCKQGCHLMKSKKRKTRLKIRKKAEREIEKADKKAEIYILTRFYDF
jgi:hypothetical protein